MMINGQHIYLFGWLAAATVLLSLVGLTVEPSQHDVMIVSQLPTY